MTVCSCFRTWLENQDTNVLLADSGFGGLYTLYRAAVRTTLESRSWLEFCKRVGIIWCEVGVTCVTEDPLQNLTKLQRHVPAYLVVVREKYLQQRPDISKNCSISQQELKMELEKSGVEIYSQEKSNTTHALNLIQGCLQHLDELGSKQKRIRTGTAYWKNVWKAAWKKSSFSKAVISPFPTP